MIKITCEVTNYDNPKKKTNMRVHNHWNDEKMVVIEIDGKQCTVVADDLKEAINNCKNTNRW